jgi:hypothetical protein
MSMGSIGGTTAAEVRHHLIFLGFTFSVPAERERQEVTVDLSQLKSEIWRFDFPPRKFDFTWFVLHIVSRIIEFTWSEKV